MKPVNVALFIILILLLTWVYYKEQLYPEMMIVSDVDGNAYTVKKNFYNIKTASDILARLNEINMKIIDHLTTKFADSTWEDDIAFLKGNYNDGILEEHVPLTTKNTSYVLNKGDEVKICLRDKKTGKIHDFNTLVFVNLHELSHMLDRNYGHNSSFWTSFKFILCEAVALGLYKPVDYRKHPTSYCGIKITSSPFFDNKSKCPVPCVDGKGSCKAKYKPGRTSFWKFS